jgi:hypothetical protein
MNIEGGCYCGAVRYRSEGEPVFRAQCHCRECQYISGGSPNVTMGMPEAGFSYVKGKPKSFSSAKNMPVTREFCGECGTHLLSKAQALAGVVLFKVGTFDQPALFEGPQMAIFTCDKQSFHQVPPGIPTFDRTPT